MFAFIDADMGFFMESGQAGEAGKVLRGVLRILPTDPTHKRSKFLTVECR